jgi:hypothetical protein
VGPQGFAPLGSSLPPRFQARWFDVGVYFLNPNIMPNHCHNSLKVSSRATEIFKTIKGEERDIDFNKIVPMPDELKNTVAPSRKPNKSLIKKYGYDNWYDWSYANWDTKWNAYNTSVKGDTIHFLTAWAPPEKVLVALSKKYPNVTFRHYYEVEGDIPPAFETVYRNGKPHISIHINK